MKELAVLIAAIFVAYLLAAALPAITDLSPEHMQVERRLDAFVQIEKIELPEHMLDTASTSEPPCD
ncbi:hypothetical protein [Planococcus lenghuensis]|uniref:Uncharacterized protein n=1 Tax=Planococcus lenghuensis TaxID=2213202 RepID=A0A1Q2KUX4_9BACL|nr:hypothetical protein [Planococcus lenghuensis]AQQ52015.1 hypothetical protein B0X71_02005 [Planococcus lenghuensis]